MKLSYQTFLFFSTVVLPAVSAESPKLNDSALEVVEKRQVSCFSYCIQNGTNALTWDISTCPDFLSNMNAYIQCLCDHNAASIVECMQKCVPVPGINLSCRM